MHRHDRERHGHPRDDQFRRFSRGEHGAEGRIPRGFGRGDGRSLGRFFAHGDLRLVILHLIAEKPRHGYEIIKAVEERVGGAYSPSPGVVYPTLALLEEIGHVTVSPGEGAKKLHAITPEGRSYLDAHRPALSTLLARMDEAGRAHGDGPAPPILRATENLKLALKLRLARGKLDEAAVRAVAAALDAAAAAVERS